MKRFEDYFIYAVKKFPSDETVALFEDKELAIQFCKYQATQGNEYEVWKRHIGSAEDYYTAIGELVYTER